MYNGMFVQNHLLAEDNWLQHIMGNNAPLAVVVLIAWDRQMCNCRGSNVGKNLCKAKL